MSPAEAASGKSQLMDDLLDRLEIPSDYGETMTALFRDKTQGDLVRGFAVQHIGLYAQALSRRGAYNPDSPASGALRSKLLAFVGPRSLADGDGGHAPANMV